MKINLIKYLTIAIFFNLIANINFAFSQAKQQKTIELTDKPPLYKFGIYGGFNMNFHSSDFTQLPGVPNCCSKFESASGDGISFGGLFDYTLNQNSGLDLRLGIETLGATYDVNAVIGNTWVKDPNSIDTNSVLIGKAVVNHKLVARVTNISFLPSYRYSFDKLNLMGGFKIGYVSSSSYEQSEVLQSPENVVFENGKLSRNIYVGNEIPDMASILFGLNFGISYDFAFNKKLIVAPEVRYEMNLNNVNSEKWKINTLIVGASVKYPIYETIEPEPLPIKEETIYNRDTVIAYNANVKSEQVILLDKSEEMKVIETDEYILNQNNITEKYQKTLPKIINIACDMEIYGVLPDGTKQATPTLIIEETEVIESFPILPQVFFKENSADISLTDINLLQPLEVEKFDEQKLEKSTLKLYENMLNIIAFRMKYNSSAKIKIVGTNKNKGIELNNQELSNNRAIAVKNYLVDIWKINPNRIEMIKRNLPQNPGNINVTDGEIENQRVEIYCDNFEILRPINIKTIEKQSNPPIMAVKPIITNIDAENSSYNIFWDIQITQNDKLLRQSTSNLEKDGVYKWSVLDEPVPLLETPIEIKLNAKNEFGGTCSKTSNVQIKQLTLKKKRFELKDDNRIERYALIVFDFDQAKLTEQHKTILSEIKSKIEPNSKVKILGYTDRVGEEAYNENLAKRRADEVQSYLKVANDKLELKAIGSKELLYDNSTPQGRAFCRTVIIEIETPIKE